MHPNAEAYLAANEERRRQWRDDRLSEPFQEAPARVATLPAEAPKAAPAPHFPPAAPRPWERPFVIPLRRA